MADAARIASDHPVLAFGRGKIDVVEATAGLGSDDPVFRLGHDAPAARPARWMAASITSAAATSSKRMVAEGEMLEHAEVFGNLYGSPEGPGRGQRWQPGCDTLFDIDWQGGQQIRNSALGKDVVSIFILPPSIAELEQPAAQPRAGQRRGDRRADGKIAGRDQPLGRIRLCAGQRRSGPCRGAVAHHPDRRADAPRPPAGADRTSCAG